MDDTTIPLAGIVLALGSLYVLVGSELAEAYGNRRVPLRERARLPRVAPRRHVPWVPLLLVVAVVGIVQAAVVWAFVGPDAAPATRMIGAFGTIFPVVWLAYLYRLPRSR